MVGMVQVMLGSKAPTLVQLVGGLINASGASSGAATANYDVVSDGLEKGDKVSVYQTLGTWLLVGAAADYEVRFTILSGSPSGTFGTWMALSTTRGVSLAAGIGAIATASVLVEIRQAGVGSALASATVSLESERF